MLSIRWYIIITTNMNKDVNIVNGGEKSSKRIFS